MAGANTSEPGFAELASASPASPAPHSCPLPRGFRCAGVSAGIKKSGATDLGLIVAPHGATAAALFTTNLAAAAPIRVSRDHLLRSRGHAMALLVNSGCANAATGPEGLQRCDETIHALSRLLACAPESILINSTGVIGVQLPSNKIVAALDALDSALQDADAEPFARAIMTTDTRMKTAFRLVRVPASTAADSPVVTFTVSGVAKGAGMIHPNMATMISVVLTDAAVEPPALEAMLRRATEQSFHRISVDGDTSTNDSIFALASGAAGECPHHLIEQAMHEVARELALMVVQDGEGFERGIEVRVTRAATCEDALQVARTVAMSLLVRTAVTGGDPNWGRILAAVGRAGVALDMDSIRISAGGVPLFAAGAPASSSLEARSEAFRQDVVHIAIDLGQGEAEDHFYSCGLTKRYVEINAEYTT
ncbi:MAG: bifunctional glutamate N-acetyltransferase/amino-acid acetyltransferase ArgJ [Phycisphaerales bacterium]|nr:bifunctional glutamate N-acetyltransferase/amino-acid acetyltransferase ArgJ [Phycisphaerales bacterium]